MAPIVWGGAFGNCQGRATALWLRVGGGLRGGSATAGPLEVFPALAVLPATSLTSHMQLAPFQLLPWGVHMF